MILDFVDSGSDVVIEKRYLHGARVDQVLAQEDGNGDVIWHLTDHLGTVKDLVDSSGTVVNHFVYDSYGNLVSQTDETVVSRYLFTGREWDSEIGLYYYRARYYDATVGRFISQDPIGFEAEDSNLYRYVVNNPVDTVDPLGLFGLVLYQNRLITYDNNGMTFTNNIQDVIDAQRRNPNVSINFDNTFAFIIYFPFRTGTDAKKSIIPPGRRPGLDDRGHIVGAQLGGSGDTINNLFAQNSIINQNAWMVYETRVRNYLDSRNLDPDCDPVGLVYSVGLSYTTLPLFPRLRPLAISAIATFTDGHLESGFAFNP